MIKINSNIFRAYDIRGKYPNEINKEVAYVVGRAFVEYIRKHKQKFLNRFGKTKNRGLLKPKSSRLKIVVGRDNRLSSPVLYKGLVQGIIDSGADVVDIGFSTSPMLCFVVAHYGFDGGIEITASHNPFQYNGFKLVREKAIPISKDNGLKKIADLILKDKFLDNFSKGGIFKKEVISDYVKFNLKEIEIDKIGRMNIIVDTGNAVPGIIIPEILKKIPVKVSYLFLNLDGNFPNRSPNPLAKGNLKTLQKEVVAKKADLGVAFDGDGDRIIFVDKKGKIISGDLITALISKILLKKNSKQKILYDIRSSNIVKEAIKENKGVAILSRVGHSFIQEKMRERDILFGGEFSGHYYYKFHYFSEAPLFVLLKILEEISKTKKSILELIEPFKKYFHSGEINFPISFILTKSKEISKTETERKILKKLERKYANGKVLKLDGLRVDFKDWWFLVRFSRTEPVLRLVIEAKTRELMKKKLNQLKQFLKNF